MVDIYISQQADRDRLTEFYLSDVWHFLTGRDVDGRPIIWTVDEKDIKDPVKPFPTDKPYLRRWVSRVVSKEEDNKFLLCDKPRQMIITTATMLALRWWAAKEEGRKFLISKRVAKEAEKLLKQKVRDVQTRMPQWMQEDETWWISPKPLSAVKFENTSEMEAVAQNVAAGAGRGSTATKVFVDEAAFQSMFGEIWAATQPMSGGLVGVSTPNNDGSQGALAWNELLDEGKKTENPYEEMLGEGEDEEADVVPPQGHDGDTADPDYD
jgi:hypothetical protein